MFNCNVNAQNPVLSEDLESMIAGIEAQVIEWRRDIHQHPEWGNREFRKAALVAEHLRSLGIEVETEVAHTDRLKLHASVRRIAENTARSFGAAAEVTIPVTTAYPVFIQHWADVHLMWPKRMPPITIRPISTSTTAVWYWVSGR